MLQVLALATIIWVNLLFFIYTNALKYLAIQQETFIACGTRLKTEADELSN